MKFCGKMLVLASSKLFSVSSKCLEMVLSLGAESACIAKEAAAIHSNRVDQARVARTEKIEKDETAHLCND